MRAVQIFLFLLIALPWDGFSQTHIEGKIVGMKSGKVTLRYENGEDYIQKSITVEDEHFSYILDHPDFVELSLVVNLPYEIRFFSEPGTVFLETALNDLSVSKISGSSANVLFQQFIDQIEHPFQQQENALNLLKDSINVFDYVNRQKELKIEQRLATQNFIASYIDSPLAAYLVYYETIYDENNAAKVSQLYKAIPEEFQQSFYGKKAKERLESQQNVLYLGQDAPDFELPDASGKIHRLSEFAGKYVMIDFWGSWCRPCRSALPTLDYFHREYHDKGLRVVGIASETRRENWQKAIERDQMNWTQLSDIQGEMNDVFKKYNVKSFPTYILIDPAGKIMAFSNELHVVQAKIYETFGL